MATASDIIKDAAVEAGTVPSGQSIDSERAARYLRFLNQMLDSWENEGITMGIGTLLSNSVLYVSDADVLTITLNLSIRIGRSARKVIDPDLRREAKDTKKLMKSQYMKQIKLEPDERLQSIMSGGRGINILTGQ